MDQLDLDINNYSIKDIEKFFRLKQNSKYKFKNIGINYCKIDNLIHGKEPGSVHFKSNKQVKKFNL